jgi:hypothetical protein
MSVPICSPCDALARLDLPSPHKRLALEHALWRPEGFLERYCCLWCRSRWEWLVDKSAHRVLRVSRFDAATQ